MNNGDREMTNELYTALVEALDELHHPGQFDHRFNRSITDHIEAVLNKARKEGCAYRKID
jgi:hypothetical protein